MNLFRLSDWTWGGIGPGILSFYHIIWLVICVISCIVFAKFAMKNKDPKTVDRVVFILNLVLIVTEIIKQYLYHFEYYGYLRVDVLPYSFCSVPMYFALIGSLTKNAKVKDISYKFLSFYGVVGGICAMIYPTSLETELVYISLQTMLWHSILVVMAVYLIIAKNYGVSFKKEVVKIFVLFFMLTMLAVGLNEGFYHWYLEPIQTPEISIDYNPGAYEYYKFGTFDEEKNISLYLTSDGDKFSITENHKDASNVVIVFDQDVAGQFALLIEGTDGSEKYVTINDNCELLLTDTIETIFDFAYYEDITVFVTEKNGINYFVTNTLEVSSDEDYTNHLDFVKVSIKQEGDYANFFFVSNHAETNIPGLNLIQKVAPYPVFVVAYLISFFMISTIVFGIVYGIRKLYNRKKIN